MGFFFFNKNELFNAFFPINFFANYTKIHVNVFYKTHTNKNSLSLTKIKFKQVQFKHIYIHNS